VQLCSTNDESCRVSWREAVLRGIATDGGLYVPTEFPAFSKGDVESLRSCSLSDLAYAISSRFLGDEIVPDTLRKICTESFTFPAPLHRLDDHTFVLELFHGPTCAFKDFGARFMARLFRHFWGENAKQLTVLVATSGDTGSAVANAFFDPRHGAPIRVAILYPSGKVSPIQRKQMTTLGHNVTAFEVDGTFDDCQALVKQALRDERLLAQTALTSANSINIARLLPQMFYYAHATLQLVGTSGPIFSVPSGNLGNLTGGLLAHTCGFTASHFIAACNANRTFPDFMKTGTYNPQASCETISNAMDVGNPSNFYRILSLFHGQLAAMCPLLSSISVSDQETRKTMRDYYERFGYILDPHTAVGAYALDRYRDAHRSDAPGVLLSTAHPAKFGATVRETLGVEPLIPSQLQETLDKEERSVPLKNSYSDLFSKLVGA